MAKIAKQVSSELTKDETAPDREVNKSLKPASENAEESNNEEEEDEDIEDYEEETEEQQDQYVEDLLFNKMAKHKKPQATRRTHRYLKR